MERDRISGSRHREDDRWPDSDAAERHVTSQENARINEDVSGNDLEEEERDRVTHHQTFGNRHYESFKNHSSADDQPMTDTGA